MADPGKHHKQPGPPRPYQLTKGGVGSGHPQGPEPIPARATQAMRPAAHAEPVVAATPTITHNASGTQPSTASSRKTRGGSTIRSAAEKSGQSLDQIYPSLFKPTNRATFKDLLSETENIRVFYPWVYANPPSANDMTKMKNEVDYRVRQVLFVFCSTKPLGRIVTDACPGISNTSRTFSDLYGYAQRISANLKHRLLFQQMYSLARTWLNDFGKTDFRLDPRIYIDAWQYGKGYQDFDKDDLEHTKRWIYSRIDATLFRVVFKQWAPIIDWENTFDKRQKKPFYYLRIMFVTMMKEIAFVVVSEEIMNEGRQWRPTIMTGWKRDDTQRRICDRVFDSLAAFENFKDIELRHFTWLPAGDSLQESNEDLVIVHSELVNQHIISNSSPPGSESDEPPYPRDSPRRKTTQRPPRHQIQRPVTTDTTGHFGMPYAMSTPKTKDTAKPQPTFHGHSRVDDGPPSIDTQGKQIIISDDEQHDHDDSMFVDGDEDIFGDSQQHGKLIDERACTSPGYDEDDQPLLRAASIKYPPHNVAAVDGQRAHGALAGPSVSQPTGTTPPNLQGITRTTSQWMSSPSPTRPGLATGSVHLPQSRTQVPIVPTSGTGGVHSRSVVQQQTRQFTTRSATVNAPTTEDTPAAKTSPTGFRAGDSTTTAQATPVTRASNRNRRKSQRALQADSNTQIAHTNTRGVTARRSGTLASRGKRGGGGDSGKRMSWPGKQQQRARLGRDTRVDDQESEGYSNF